MPREFGRNRRLGEQMQRELATLVLREVKDPRLSLVTISGVEVTRDLSIAKVYVTVLGDTDDPKALLDILKRANGFFRSALAERLRVRVVPELRFVFDDVAQKGMRLSQLIDKAVASDKHLDDDDPEDTQDNG